MEIILLQICSWIDTFDGWRKYQASKHPVPNFCSWAGVGNAYLLMPNSYHIALLVWRVYQWTHLKIYTFLNFPWKDLGQTQTWKKRDLSLRKGHVALIPAVKIMHLLASFQISFHHEVDRPGCQSNHCMTKTEYIHTTNFFDESQNHGEKSYCNVYQLSFLNPFANTLPRMS